MTWVYPRACGGTLPKVVFWRDMMGLSPRMRGNLKYLFVSSLSLRSIPAHAGEPTKTPATVFLDKVYPRACGGTAHGRWIPWNASGLSPRMRGNLQ